MLRPSPAVLVASVRSTVASAVSPRWALRIVCVCVEIGLQACAAISLQDRIMKVQANLELRGAGCSGRLSSQWTAQAAVLVLELKAIGSTREVSVRLNLLVISKAAS